MEKLEKEFEELLIKTNNTELINKYADLKTEIYKVLELADAALLVKDKNPSCCLTQEEIDTAEQLCETVFSSDEDSDSIIKSIVKHIVIFSVNKDKKIIRYYITVVRGLLLNYILYKDKCRKELFSEIRRILKEKLEEL